MKNKLFAALTILMLLFGVAAMAINLAPTVNAVSPPYYLTITAPAGIVTSPAPGVYTYDVEHWVNCTAPSEVVIDDTKYLFSNWVVSPLSGEWSAGLGQMWVHVDQNKTAQAVYTKQHKFTVTYPWVATWDEQFTPYIWLWGSGFVAGNGANGTYWAWINENSEVSAGISSARGIWRGTPHIHSRLGQEVVSFVNWTTYGYYISDPYAWSNKINMTGPRTATMEWKFVYYLTVNSDQSPEPAGEDWYDKDTPVTLTANKIVVNWAREWRIDHWEVDGVSRGQGVNPINVTMDTNHTASAFYKCWVFVKLADDIGNMSGIEDTGKWYQEGVPYSFTAPDPVNIDDSHRYGFKYWAKYPGYAWTNTSNPVCVIFDATWAGYTLRAIYHMQYKLNLFSSPPEAPDEPNFLYPDSDMSGWYWASSTVSIKALPIISTTTTSRWKFLKWRNQYGGENPNNNITFAMDRPWNVTAFYDLEFLAQWSHSPTTITVPGFPDSAWVKNGTYIGWSAPQIDTSGNFVFYYWVVNSVTYPQGQNDLTPLFVTGSINGVAYYANKTKIFMDPSYHEETSHAYCNTFDVSVYASNFDANRLVGGQPMDIYGFDIRIKWDPTLVELVNVNLNLGAFFAPNAYFIAMNKIDNTAGTYELAATVKGNYTGFSGTKAIFTMTFHVIKDVCYPDTAGCWIEFDPAQRELANHLGNVITPELGWGPDCRYVINSVKPMLEVRDAVDHDNQIKVDKNVPQTYFNVEVFLHNGVKVKDFYVVVQYNKTHIEAVSVAIASYLKPPYTTYSWSIDKGAGKVYVNVVQDPSVPLQNCSGLLFTINFKVIQAIFYTISGPHELMSDIKIVNGYLSVKCPTSRNQVLNIDLGAKDATYLYNPLPGDLDFDGSVTVLDLQLIADNYHKTPAKYDITGDGETDLYDLVFVALRFGEHV